MNRIRRGLMIAATAITGGAVAQGCATSNGGAKSAVRHYVLVHGAWHGGWAWHKLAPLLRQAGHTVSTPTLSGLGERAHLSPGICGLHAHVRDIVEHLRMEDLRDVVLVGHSYAGCVVSGVLAARTGRVAHAVYLDAFVPMQGESMSSFVPPPVRAGYAKLAAQNALVPPPPAETWGERWGILDPAMLAWAKERITPQAVTSFTETVVGDPMADDIRRTYMKCTQNPNPSFVSAAAASRKNPRFASAEVDGHHDVMLTDPQRLAAALLALK